MSRPTDPLGGRPSRAVVSGRDFPLSNCRWKGLANRRGRCPWGGGKRETRHVVALADEQSYCQDGGWSALGVPKGCGRAGAWELRGHFGSLAVSGEWRYGTVRSVAQDGVEEVPARTGCIGAAWRGGSARRRGGCWEYDNG
jgi:hypothetical protein